jgi:hypothetical protein
VYWNGNGDCKGPIFFYTGNEGDITLFWENTGFLTDYLGPKFEAMIVFAEHRLVCNFHTFDSLFDIAQFESVSN